MTLHPIQNHNVQIMDNDIHNLTEQRLTELKTKDAARYVRQLGIGIIFATLSINFLTAAG